MTELVTGRLPLRRWRPSDREPFAALNADPRVVEFMPALLSRESSDALILRFEEHFTRHGFDSLVSFTVPSNLPSRRVVEKLGMTHTPSEDFDHPALPPGHPLRRHVLYRLFNRPIELPPLQSP